MLCYKHHGKALLVFSELPNMLIEPCALIFWSATQNENGR